MNLYFFLQDIHSTCLSKLEIAFTAKKTTFTANKIAFTAKQIAFTAKKKHMRQKKIAYTFMLDWEASRKIVRLCHPRM